MRVLLPEFGFGGLNTKADATGLPLLECTHLQDVRVVGRDLVGRKGIARVGRLTGTASAMDFDGVNQHLSAAVDTRAWALGLNFTVEVAIELDVVTPPQGILCVGSTTPTLIIDLIDISGSNSLRVRVWDSGGTATTVVIGDAATSVQTIQVTRDGATLSTRLNNGTAVTGSMSATLLCRTPAGDLRIARDDGTNYLNGTVCYVRAASVSRSHHRDRLMRWAAPRAPHVRADYDLNASAAGLVYDRSRYEAHLIAQNSPSEIATLCHNPAPVRGLSMMSDENQKKALLMLAGGQYFIAGVD